MHRQWVERLREALNNLGGSASLAEIYGEIRRIVKFPLTAKWQATVRNTLESYSSDSKNWREGKPNYFKATYGIGVGPLEPSKHRTAVHDRRSVSDP